MTAEKLPDDPTLDEVRAALAQSVAENAAFDGWSRAAVDIAADQALVSRDIAALAFDGGAMAMIDAWFAHVDAEMLRLCPTESLGAMKVRDRISSLIEARLDILSGRREALRRAMATMAMPLNLARAAKLGWRAADVMWRAAGDSASDFSYYSKRATLAAVYSATLLVFVDDESPGHEQSRAFLRRRIDDVMRFEKQKAKFAKQAERRPSLARFVGRLRYRPR